MEKKDTPAKKVYILYTETGFPLTFALVRGNLREAQARHKGSTIVSYTRRESKPYGPRKAKA